MLIALAVAAACSAGEPTGPAQSGIDVADLPIALAPRQVTLEAGQTALFRAYERGASVADSLVTSVEWTTTGGTIQSDGVYSSGATGAFRVIGKKRGQVKQVGDTASIIVVPSQPNVTSVVIAPGLASVPAGGQQIFTAVGKLSDGTTVSIGVEWTTTGGTIDAGGMLTAGSTPGNFQVIAKAASANVADTIPVTVTPVLQSIGLSPSSVTLAPGATQQFQVTGRASDGSAVAITGATFTATGGTISNAGNYTAGSATGTYQVTATVAGPQSTTLTARATVTIAAASGNLGVTGGANEPAGMNYVTSRAYAAFGENGWYDGQPNGNFVLMADLGAPSATVGRMTFPAGSGTTWLAGNAPGTSSSSTLPADKRYRQIYMSFWLKVSSNWYGNPVVNKVGFAWIGAKPKFDFALQGGGSSPLFLQMRLQALFSGGSDGAINLPNNLGSGTFSRGAWHFVEMVAVANSNGAANGQIYWWLDGRPVGSATNIAWVGPTESSTWESVMWQPVWGGGAADIPQNQYMYLDNFYTSGK